MIYGRQTKKATDKLKTDAFHPQPARQHLIPKADRPGKFRALAIPLIYDRVCQQAPLNRLEPIFEGRRRVGYAKYLCTLFFVGEISPALPTCSYGRIDGLDTAPAQEVS